MPAGSWRLSKTADHALDNGVDLLLVVVAIFLPGCVGFFDFGANLLDGDEVFVFEHGL